MGQRPPASTPAVRAFMARQRRRDTGPELALRRVLHARGLRFRVQMDGLPGRPDVVFTRARVAVFVDGCFWHGCPLHAVAPKANAGWWREKLDRNAQRDQEVNRQLASMGWQVLRVWEHEPVDAAADRVMRAWQKGLAVPP